MSGHILALAKPLCAIVLRSLLLSNNSWIALVISTVHGGTRSAPSPTISGTPPTAVQIAGVPAESASRLAIPNDSEADELT